MFSYGKDKQTARVAGEFYVNAINVMRGAEGVSTYAPIDEAEKFRIEYWALEEAKLQRMPTPKPLATRIALVTGAASGIGKAIATKLAAEGACVVIADLSLEKAQAAAAEIGGTDVAVGRAGRRRPTRTQVQAVVDAAVLAFGGLDLVVNNAGLSLSKSLLDTTVADWDLQHDVMAKGSFLVSRAAARVLIDQGLGGDIVYISSKNSVFAGPNNIAYSATKADQAHQVRLLAAELGEHGVKVNGINPDGVVRGSGIFAGGWGAQRAAVYGVDEEDLGEFYAQRTLLKREVLPEHVRQRGVRARRREHHAHDRPAHPGRRRRRRRLPAVTSMAAQRSVSVAAVDLGASSGRVMLGEVGHRPRSASRPCARFANGPVRTPDGLHWDLPELYRQRLRRAGAAGPRRRRPRERRHRLLGRRLRAAPRRPAARPARPLPRRAARRARSPTSSTPACRPPTLYARNGLQFLPFNTVYQLAADDVEGRSGRRHRAAGPRPARPTGSPASSGDRAHQRLDDRAARRAPPATGTTT